MRLKGMLGLVIAIGMSQGVSAWDLNVATRVVEYRVGTGAGLYVHSEAALGEPSRETLDPKWGSFPVDPFGSAYQTNQVVTIGEGGVLTLEFERPVLDDPSHPYGLDFQVFGNAFLQLNGDWTTASGLLGGTNKGVTRVWVSADGTDYFLLDPAKVPVVDAWWPTDGLGDFSRPMNPALDPAGVSGNDLAGVRVLYGGSGGGAGYDLGWAVDAKGSNVVLQAVRFVRFEQVSGDAEVDAVCAVGQAVAWAESFDNPPVMTGWRVWGDETLFGWSNLTGWLGVTWDSRKSNTYFARPLGTVLSRVDDFAVMFDLRLDSITMGIDPAKAGMFQLAVGLLGWESATRTNFARGSGMNLEMGPRNTLEFDYFPDTGYGATVSPTIVSRENEFASEFVFPMELPMGRWLRVGMYYTAAEGVLRTRVTDGVKEVGLVKEVKLAAQPAGFDFRLDTVAVCSYSDAGQDPMYGGSILASGAVDNVAVSLPRLPVEEVELRMPAVGGAGVTVEGVAGWTYTLLRSTGLEAWTDVLSRVATASGAMDLMDPEPPSGRAYYRVVAAKP